jgi:phosphoglycerate kinase
MGIFVARSGRSEKNGRVMKRKTIRQLDIQGRKILIRVDFNVPLQCDGAIKDDQRIREALPTIKYALGKNCSVILMSHLGRPKGDPGEDRNLRMNAVADRLRVLLPGVNIEKSDDVAGPAAKAAAERLGPGRVLLLENLRFDPGEKKGDLEFSQRLHSFADIYINDAFASCHRKDASMWAVPMAFPAEKRAIGLLVEKEISVLDKLLANPEKPSVAVMGGAKISDKLGVMKSLVSRFDFLLVGGALSYTCLKARGSSVGESLVDAEKLPEIRRMEEESGEKLLLPLDHVISFLANPKVNCRTVTGEIPAGWAGMDIGPLTVEAYCKVLSSAGTIVWNGPMGKFEDVKFRNGTLELAKCVGSSRAVKVLGGGETGEAVKEFGLSEKMTFISTGGGAFLAYLEKGNLPALSLIEEER